MRTHALPLCLIVVLHLRCVAADMLVQAATPQLDGRGALTPALEEARRAASLCFAAPPERGCGALFIATRTPQPLRPSVRESGSTRQRRFVLMANASATSLARWLPGARSRLVYARTRAGEPLPPPETTSAFTEVVGWEPPRGVRIASSWLEKALILTSTAPLFGSTGEGTRHPGRAGVAHPEEWRA